MWRVGLAAFLDALALGRRRDPLGYCAHEPPRGDGNPGVAPLAELARCSRHDPQYQRNLIETHREEIERFLDESSFLFFPEVILSAVLRHRAGTRARRKPVQPIHDVLYGRGFKSNVDGVEVTVANSRLPQSMQFVGGRRHRG